MTWLEKPEDSKATHPRNSVLESDNSLPELWLVERSGNDHSSGDFMPTRCFFHASFILLLVTLLGVPKGLTATTNQLVEPLPATAATERRGATNPPPVFSIEAARERARLLHDVYATTLDVMHEHYFRREGAVLPARAMEDIFSEMAGLSGIYANWISVNTQPMSIQHEPKTAFEKRAASELAAGKKEFEYIGKGVYRRAATIPLRSSCVSCHTKMFSEAPKTPRFAGLVISIPLQMAGKK